ncbi:MAG: putative metallopeptidase [Ignavibacteria bacterium]
MDIKNLNNGIDEFLDNYKSTKPKVPVKREFSLCDDMKFMANEIISREKIDVHPAKIEYVTVEPNISKSVAAKCVRTGKELKFFSGFDYIIEISGELWTALDKDTRSILLEHELRHILVLQNDKTGDWNFKLRKHDIQDFGKIVSCHGIDWIKKVKLCLSSLYDLTPVEEDNIQI